MSSPAQTGRPSRLTRNLLLLCAALLALLIGFFRTFSFCSMVGVSMLPTLPPDSLFLIQKRGYTPKRGAVVVIQKDSFIAYPIVKRVVATGGEHVAVDYDANTVYVNGVALDEPYLYEPMVDTGRPFLAVLDVTVPEGSVYVLGDNRNNSLDSRDERLGTVEEEYILGRMVLALPVSYP